MANITKNAQEGDQLIEKEQMHVKQMTIYPRTSENEGGGIQIYRYSGWWWSYLNVLSVCPMAYGIAYMISRYFFIERGIENNMKDMCLAFQPFLFIQLVSVFVIQIRRRGMQNRLVGRLEKFMIDVIAICIALIFRQFVPFDFGWSSITVLIFLTSLTIQIHSWMQVLHLAGDISLKDMLEEIFMEVSIYISGTTLCFFLVFSFCGFICFKYYSYSPPNRVEITKKDLESLPC